MKKITFLALFSELTLSSIAQNKFGHINAEEIMSLMPETKKAQIELESFQKGLEAQLSSLNIEFESKYTDYMNIESSLDDLTKQDKEAEIKNLQQRMQNFQQNAQQSIQAKQNELLIPINDKLKNAIKEVASEGKYTYIFTIEIFLYAEESKDIGSLVKAKLGL